MMPKGQRVILQFVYKSIRNTAQQIYRRCVNNLRLWGGNEEEAAIVFDKFLKYQLQEN